MIWTVHFGYDNKGWHSFEQSFQLMKDAGKYSNTLGKVYCIADWIYYLIRRAGIRGRAMGVSSGAGHFMMRRGQRPQKGHLKFSKLAGTRNRYLTYANCAKHLL